LSKYAYETVTPPALVDFLSRPAASYSLVSGFFLPGEYTATARSRSS
jgi:hypothetical protein